MRAGAGARHRSGGHGRTGLERKAVAERDDERVRGTHVELGGDQTFVALDAEFVAGHTDGWDAMAEFLADYPPHRVSEITGLDESDIRTAARMIADAGD